MKSIDFLDELYGTEEKNQKALFVIGAVLFLFAIFIIVTIFYINVDTVLNIIRWYLLLFFMLITLFIFSSYFFMKKKNKARFKRVKYIVFIISLISLSITFLPITIIDFLTGKIKFNYFFPYITIYITALCIPMVVNIFVWVITYYSLLKVSWLNASTIAALISFFVWLLGGKLILFLYHEIGKHRLNDKAYVSIKKDLYVCIFIMITFFTIVANCINFPPPYNDMVKGVSSAFAIYIAFDRLYGKWDKANKDLEK